ncbi:Glycosyltransferase like family 2 [Dyadobacter koreensis]|uniref:Glycosyltransferase like family 2 n=1 Tax=Dyadobacter koreensis TaxID=408657 RepID=A0A1H7B629_9BACT|nr:glycosyltransferase family A protein [Dyadobacter koreensis]SEJ69912.1 Glycosyltransferase like family 2 [Dyadobacter koreensis]
MIESRISFCTVITDRIEHLKQTLHRNLAATENEKNVEFLILDYNSGDNVAMYVKDHFSHYIESGRLVFYRTEHAPYFDRCHSRNMIFKLASGDIICNLDVDNYVVKGLVDFIRKTFEESPQSFLTYIHPSLHTIPDVMGRIVMRRVDFIKIRGYDESMQGYGFEDHDVANRLEGNGLTRTIMPTEFAQAITHSQYERIRNEYLLRGLHSLYFFHQNPAQTTILLLLMDNHYQLEDIIDNKLYKKYPKPGLISQNDNGTKYSLLPSSRSTGIWKRDKETICFQNKFGIEVTPLDVKNDILFTEDGSRTSVFQKISNNVLIVNTVMLYSQLFNKSKMATNSTSTSLEINKYGFGKGIVFRNFENVISIEIK